MSEKSLKESFIEFAEALKLAQQGDGSKLPSSLENKDDKLSILKLDGYVVYTLTRRGNLFRNQSTWCQFRVWVRKGWMREDGNHVDGYGDGCIFNVLGPFDELKTLAEQYLTKNHYMMEDSKYVVWL
jgi:hypothetical protein